MGGMHKASLLALAFILTLSRGVVAEETGLRASKPEVRKEIIATIDAQLAAFRKHDVLKAYSYAAEALRAQKPLSVFEAIVRANYPEIWTNTRAECGIVRDNGEIAAVLVHIFGKESDASYDYTLVKETGGWRIQGVLRHEPLKEEKI
jgi:hypothetical protein